MVTELQQTKGSYFILITEIKIKIITAFGETSRLTMYLFCDPWWGKEIMWVEKKVIDMKKMSSIIQMILVTRTRCSQESPGKNYFFPAMSPKVMWVPASFIILQLQDKVKIPRS